MTGRGLLQLRVAGFPGLCTSPMAALTLTPSGWQSARGNCPFKVTLPLEAVSGVSVQGWAPSPPRNVSSLLLGCPLPHPLLFGGICVWGGLPFSLRRGALSVPGLCLKAFCPEAPKEPLVLTLCVEQWCVLRNQNSSCHQCISLGPPAAGAEMPPFQPCVFVRNEFSIERPCQNANVTGRG